MNSIAFPAITQDRRECRGALMSELTLKTEDQKWNALHSHEIATFFIRDKILREERDSEVINVKDLHLNDYGTLNLGDEELFFSPDGFRKLVDKLECGGASFLAKMDEDVRAFALNRIISNLPSQSIKIHTRKTSRGPTGRDREVFSVTGENFPDSAQSLELIDRIAANAPKESKVIWAYNPNKATVSYETILKLYDTETRIGDPHQASIRWLLRDAGFGSLLPSFKVYRHRCANMVLLSGKSYELPRAVHRGKMDTIQKSIEGAFNQSERFMTAFYNSWNIAGDVNARCRRVSADSQYYPGTSNQEYATQVFTQLIPKYKGLKISSDPKQTMNAYSQAFMVEPDRSFRGITNAITHASKDRPLHISDAMQEAAGNILHDLTLA